MSAKTKIRKKEKKDQLHRITAADYVLALVCLIIVLMTIYPFLNVLAISFNDPIDTMRNINFLIPREFTINNYTYLFREKDLMAPFLMSVARTVIGTLTGLICSAMLAYTMSRKDFYFVKPISILFIITMYVSGGMVPEYLLIMRTLGLGGKFIVYILPGLIWVWNVILLRSFMDGLPPALEEAAMIDGANDFVIWWKVVLPLCTPVLATVALFIAVGQWNSFMDTYLYARDLPTLQYILYEITEKAQMRIDVHGENAERLKNAVSPLSLRMAVTIVATVPILVVYPFLQKYFVGGMTLGAVKN